MRVAAAGLVALLAASQARADELPPGIVRLLPAGHEVIATETADLNGDGHGDYLVVTETEVPHGDELVEHLRSLFIVTTSADEKPRIAARNDRVVYCRECGGMFPDPFEGIVAQRNEFSVRNFGGTAWRWANEFVFRFSRRDRAWQLVKVVEGMFHIGSPEDDMTKTYIPDRDFRKIDFTDFDPANYRRKAE